MCFDACCLADEQGAGGVNAQVAAACQALLHYCWPLVRWRMQSLPSCLHACYSIDSSSAHGHTLVLAPGKLMCPLIF